MQKFKFAAGTCIGSDHHRAMKNSQDAISLLNLNDDTTIGIVADGCGSCKHSEVGAKYAVEFIQRQFQNYYKYANSKEFILTDVILLYIRDRLIQDLKSLKVKFESEFNEYFLFTIVGFLTNSIGELLIFHEGDGYYEVNGESFVIEQNNRPSYLAYNVNSQVSELTIRKFNIENVNNFLISTDGIDYYKQRYNVDEFYNPEIFDNPQSLSRYLKVLNQPSIKLKDGEISKSGYKLHDDISLIVAIEK